MFSEKDFERLWFLYKTDGEPKGVSIKSFCISNNIPYTAFYDWFKRTQKKIVPVEVEGIPEELIQTGYEEQDVTEVTISNSIIYDPYRHIPDGSIPNPSSYPLYEYMAYTFDRKYENEEFQKKVNG